MPFMEWTTEYATGIRDVDNDHQILFTFVNDLHDRMRNEASADDISETFAGLVNYVNVHFVREENFMDKANYEDLAEHAESHRRLSSRLFALKEAFDEHPDNFDRDSLLEFLKGWLTGHILYTDMDYIPSFREAGLTEE